MKITKATFKKAIPSREDEMSLKVENAEAAIPFSESILGFRVSFRKDSPSAMAILSRDDIQIALAENGGDPTQDGCVFEVDDVEVALAEINTNGLKKDMGDILIENHGDTGWRVFYLVAPDGLCYCIGEKQS